MKAKLADVYKIVKEWWGRNQAFVFFGVLLFLIVVLGVGILRLWMLIGSKPSVQFLDSDNDNEEVSQETLHQRYIQASGLPGLVAASRNGKRYYYPWCGGIKQIKEKNLVWFATEKAAETAGYTVAKGCKGL